MAIMQVHSLQHAPFEGMGEIESWFRTAGCGISVSRLYDSPLLPRPTEVEFLVVMGGPMSVNDEQDFVWLAPEKKFIRDVIALGTPVLGICLGAQLIASAMGSRVYRNHQREIGWFPVTAVPSARGSAFKFPASIDAFHWHGETFDLPAGSVHLARSVACENQAFLLGRNVIGLQFHLETTPVMARSMVENCRDEMVLSEFVQNESAIMSAAPARYARMHELMGDVLSFLSNPSRSEF